MIFLFKMVAKKHKSNRLKARDKYKIQSKVREHARKTRKLSKSNPKKKKIINHIPNDFPFKDELLAQAQTLKQVKSLQPKPVPTMPVTPVEAKQELKLRPKIYELYKHTVSQSDLLIQVLDGRDPMFSRSLELEQIVMKKNLIIVLTRADLIPVSILKGWISIFSKYCPVVPFGLTCGPEMSVQIINNYVLAQNATKVGIVGYPGVGKSTLVAYLSKFVELQSQNGIIFSKTTDSNESPSVLLRNYSKAAHVPDPEHALKHLVNKFGLDDLCQYFKVAYSSAMNDFLMQIARRQGFIRKVIIIK